MPVVLKYPHTLSRPKSVSSSDAHRAAIIFIAVFLIIGMAFLYGVIWLRQAPAEAAAADVPNELLSLARRADAADGF